jgi:hypothetical protein
MRYGPHRLTDMSQTFVNRIETYQLSTEKIASLYVAVGVAVTVCYTGKCGNVEVIN